MEVRVPCANPDYPMFTHQDCRVRIVEHIPRQLRNLFNNLLGNIGMPLRGNEHAEPPGAEQSRHEAPSLRGAPRTLHNPWVSGHAQELVKDRPCGVPRIRQTSFDARATRALWHAMANPRQQRRPECSRRRQALGYRPSMAWYRASRSAISTIAPPL